MKINIKHSKKESALNKPGIPTKQGLYVRTDHTDYDVILIVGSEGSYITVDRDSVVGHSESEKPTYWNRFVWVPAPEGTEVTLSA